MPKRAKKKAEPKVAADTPASRLEPDEPELNVAPESTPEGETEVHTHASVPVADDEGPAEATAEAADTFEQAFEERLPSERRVVVPAELRVSETTEHQEQAEEAAQEETSEQEAEDGEPPAERPPARLERLQKILSQAGVASRRHAEEMITQGRVQVNGKVVTELGSKADPERDHIRVDGKLLRGAERLRYFVLNKPRGFVTTVSDPEGRPTAMQFFQKLNERLYPVGRLDYQSEGLLVVTNDGDLANKLTRPASGVEKTYLVKVSGQPGAEELNQLRAGLAIDRTRAGEGRVWTAPATVRQVRSGENPWYEVVLTEGRNRELRKMFEEIGHHVEKIRRVGYGPLVLDLEPGKFRELDPEEVARLRLAAEGKWRRPKAKEPEHRTKEFKRGPRPQERGRTEQRRAPDDRPRSGERPRSDERRDRGATRGDRDATRSRPGSRGQERNREDRGRREGFTPTEKRRAPGRSSPQTRPAGREQGWRPRREDATQAPRTGGHAPRTGGFAPRTGGHAPRTGAHAPRTGEQFGQKERRPGRAPGRGFERASDTKGFQGGTVRRGGPRPETRGSAGGPKFDREGYAQGSQRGPSRPAGPRPDTRGSAGGRSGKRYPTGGQGRSGQRGEKRPPSTRPAGRRSSSPRGQDKPRGPRGSRS